jgi:hypothetical protein
MLRRDSDDDKRLALVGRGDGLKGTAPPVSLLARNGGLFRPSSLRPPDMKAPAEESAALSFPPEGPAVACAGGEVEAATLFPEKILLVAL